MTDNSEYIDYERTHTGNKWGQGIKDPAERQVAYQSYCDHIATGRSKDSWFYDNPKNGAHWSWETIEKWIKEGNEFDPFLKKKAEAKCFGFFENQLLNSITGENTKVNIAGLQMAMRNKFGWDRQERREMNTPEILASYERVMLMLSDRQKQAKEIDPVVVQRIEIHPDNKV